MSKSGDLLLRVTDEDGDDLLVWRLEDGRLALTITFFMESQSIVLTREQESKLKLALRHPRD